jgi:hypothetical protein
MAFIGNDLSTIVKQGKTAYKYVATSGQTVFSGSDANGLSLVCTADTFVNVYLNGVRLIKGDDFTLSTNTLTLLVGASADDELTIVADIESATYTSYTKSEVYTKSETDSKIVELAPPLDLSAIDQSIIPDTDVTYDIGSSSQRFRDLYLSGNTIYMGDFALSYDAVAHKLKASQIQYPDISAYSWTTFLSVTGVQTAVFTDKTLDKNGSQLDGSEFQLSMYWGVISVQSDQTPEDVWNSSQIESRSYALAYTYTTGEKEYIWYDNQVNGDWFTTGISNINAVNMSSDPLIPDQWDVTFDLTFSIYYPHSFGTDALIIPAGNTVTMQGINYGYNTSDWQQANLGLTVSTSTFDWAYDLPSLPVVETTIIDSSSITSLIADKANLTTGTTQPSSPSNGDLWYDTNTGVKALKIWDGTEFIKVSVAIPTLTAVSGNILNTVETSLTLTGTNFLLSDLTVTFTVGGTNYDVVVTPTSDTEATVTVPSGVYNQSSGTSVAIKVTNSDNAASTAQSKTVTAVPSGGTITTFGSYRIHAFTSGGTFTNTLSGLNIDVMVVAGGGGGGGNTRYNGAWSGGGGAGGLIFQQGVSLSTTGYSISIGGGGGVNSNGGNSSAFGYTAIGGGYGGGNSSSSGVSGGSGGGGLGDEPGPLPGGSGTSGQGYAGGPGTDPGGDPFWEQGGGGGGAAEAGNTDGIGFGGDGRDMSSYFGTTYGESGYFAGGGAGGSGTHNGGTTNEGGLGGGGDTQGGYQDSIYTQSGAANTGGGGSCLQSGGSGIVIVRYQL